MREFCDIWHHARKWFYDRKSDQFDSNLEGIKPSLEPNALALPLVGEESHLAPMVQAMSAMRVYSIQSDLLRESQDPDDGRVLRGDGRNAVRAAAYQN